jgi:hypothetical protein
MKVDKVDLRQIPECKAWTIRGGVKAIQEQKDIVLRHLERKDYTTGDLGSLRRASQAWLSGAKDIPVGESRTLLICLTVEAKRQKARKNFILEGTLKNRPISQCPEIGSLRPEELLKLDGGTTQWATAMYLAGDKRRVEKPSPKLAMTYEFDQDWEMRKLTNRIWRPRKDQVILAQATAYLHLLRTGKLDFVPREAEDFCFARTFGLMGDEEGARRWPSLAGHESNRLISMAKAYSQVIQRELVDSKDHRVVQAAAMFAKASGLKAEFAYPESVNKSWPGFWDFMASATTAV